MRPNAAIALASLLLVGSAALVAQRRDAFQESAAHPAIGYTTREVHDRVQQLNERLAAGTSRLTFESGTGYLSSLLAALGVPVESQMLVFSKTSAQADLITIKNPRALYFSDDMVYKPVIEHGVVLFVLWLICFWMYRQKIFIRI